MSSETPFSEEEIISRLTATPELYLDGMIRTLQPAQPSTIDRQDIDSSLGQLDELPLELLFYILHYLDFRSLSKTLQLSLKGKAAVEAIPAYQQVMKHIPVLLPALRGTGLLDRHSCLLILQTLRSDQCTSCFEYGGFIFLPTCERICFECLHLNEAYWMIPAGVAQKCFRITAKKFKEAMSLSMPGNYSVATMPSYRKSVHALMSVKEAKLLSIQRHGSAEAIAAFSLDNVRNASEALMFQRFRELSLEPPGKDLSRLPSKASFGGDRYSGVASMRFPYVSDSGTADFGRLCEGCYYINRHYNKGTIPASILAKIVPPGMTHHGPLHAIQRRLYSRDRFLKHIGSCYGAQQILSGKDDRVKFWL